MVATLDLGQAKLSSPVLVVPLSAIVSPADGTNTFNVFVVTGEGDQEVARRREFNRVQTFGNKVAIAKGAALGERVITNGATLVTTVKLSGLFPEVTRSVKSSTDGTPQRHRPHPERTQHCSLFCRKPADLLDLAWLR